MVTFHLDAADWIVVLLGVLGAMIAGVRSRVSVKQNADTAVDYILAGRSLTTPLFAASLIATWYGSVLGAGEFIARHGIVMLFCFGIPYYIVAIAYALLLSRRIRSSTAVSIADQIRLAYGEHAGIVAAVMMLVISIPAPFMLSLGLMIQSLTGLGLTLSVISGSAVAFFIVAKGGLRSDVHANVVQVVLMYAGFGILAIWCVISFGSPSQLFTTLPSRYLELPGTVGWGGIAVWFLIALQTFVDPNFHVRAAAARSSDVARRGLLWSVAGWMVFDSLQLMVGLYAVAYTTVSDPSQTLMVVAQTALPAVWKGLFVAGVLAAIMSTLDGYALSSATIIGHDVIDRIRGGGHRRSSLLIGLIITGVLGSVMSILLPSVVDLIFYAASIAVPALFLPLISSLMKGGHHHHGLSASRRSGATLAWMIVPGLVSATAMALRMTSMLDIEPMLAGLIASVLFLPRILKRDDDTTH